ncbi:hypothetical protein B0H11DRAFT_2098332 [Mycena galericulata]|nr:hypothetical protein B0H11DRAFT_2098332 [Mycena galericulata]
MDKEVCEEEGEEVRVRVRRRGRRARIHWHPALSIRKRNRAGGVRVADDAGCGRGGSEEDVTCVRTMQHKIEAGCGCAGTETHDADAWVEVRRAAGVEAATQMRACVRRTQPRWRQGTGRSDSGAWVEVGRAAVPGAGHVCRRGRQRRPRVSWRATSTRRWRSKRRCKSASDTRASSSGERHETASIASIRGYDVHEHTETRAEDDGVYRRTCMS